MSAVFVVIPAYNEAATVRDVVLRASAYWPRVIVVDDGSTDGTAAQIADLPVIVLRHAANRGKAAALWTGIQRALAEGAEAVVTLDADGQHRPEDIPRFIEAWRQRPGCLVMGARLADRLSFPPARYYANRVANFWLSWACGVRLPDSQCGFRLYPSALLRAVCIAHDEQHGFVFESEILIEAASRDVCLVSLPIPALYPPGARASHFRSVRDVWRIARMVAWRLLSRGLYPCGLYRAYLRPRVGELTSTRTDAKLDFPGRSCETSGKH